MSDAHQVGLPAAWLAFGACMQVLFLCRAVVQWWSSELARDSVVPPLYWWLSLIASTGLGVYFLRRGDPVGQFGQLIGLLVATRNLVLFYASPGRRWPWIAGFCGALLGACAWLWLRPPFAVIAEGLPVAWQTYGWCAQIVFAGRWIVQWIAAERARRSVAPRLFWWCNLIGGTALLIYFLRRGDPIGIAGQLFNSVLVARNLMLLARRRSHARSP